MSNKPTQKQMYYRAVEKSAEVNELFLEMVKLGLTKQELVKNINRRPSLWKRFENWIDKLPDEGEQK